MDPRVVLDLLIVVKRKIPMLVSVITLQTFVYSVSIPDPFVHHIIIHPGLFHDVAM